MLAVWCETMPSMSFSMPYNLEIGRAFNCHVGNYCTSHIVLLGIFLLMAMLGLVGLCYDLIKGVLDRLFPSADQSDDSDSGKPQAPMI